MDTNMDECNSHPMTRKSILEKVEEIAVKDDITLEKSVIVIHERVSLGEIRLIDPNPPTIFIDFFASLYSTWFWLVFTVLVLMSLTIYILPQVPPFTWIRVGLGFLTSLYLPGYTFVEALYPQKPELEDLERFALGVGLSLALTPLVGFVLNYTPWGIRLYSITVSITILTLLFGIIGIYRKFKYHMLMLELRDDS
jgi:hypothetical protein